MTPKILHSQAGQALAEMTIGLIALAVAFLVVLLVGDMAQKRVNALLASREATGSFALAGLSAGSPAYYGAGDDPQSLQSQILDVAEHPIAYSQYNGAQAPYMLKNLVAPFYNPQGSLIDSFALTMSERTLYVTNTTFLQSMGIGSGTTTTIPVKQQTCLPLMKDFP